MSDTKIYRSTPLVIEDQGVVRLNGGTNMRKWHIRMMDGTTGLCWTPVEDADGNQFPCPFTKGRNTTYTKVEQQGRETKIRPYDATDFDKQDIITRQACVNSAAALGASIDNFKEYAEMIHKWVTRS